MANQLREAVEKQKQYYIQKLRTAGVFKHDDRKLYKLTLSELQKEHDYTFKNQDS